VSQSWGTIPFSDGAITSRGDRRCAKNAGCFYRVGLCGILSASVKSLTRRV